MLAVDTNIVVRYLARDNAAQTARADRLFHTQPILLPKTVVLETELVLRYRYGFDRQAIVASLRALAGLPDVHLEDAPVVAQALDWFAAGMDFADALHLASSGTASRFATFDRALATSARRLGATKVLLLP
jgi:predicted nucleic-acid-binding protein